MYISTYFFRNSFKKDFDLKEPSTDKARQCFQKYFERSIPISRSPYFQNKKVEGWEGPLHTCFFQNMIYKKVYEIQIKAFIPNFSSLA